MIDAIVKHKRSEVKLREEVTVLASFMHLVKPTDRSLTEALTANGPSFIFECKKSSPSKGLLRADFNIEEIAKSYAPFAAAISVLTDSNYFSGKLSYLNKVRSIVNCPVICKDFIISTYQVYEARRFGADAILLMLSVLNDEAANEIVSVCRSLNMDVLVEVHTEEELKRALKMPIKIIGINNRDFKTLKVDLSVSRRLIPLIHRDRLIVIESGIFTHEEINEFKNKVQGFLIGTSLMCQPNLDLAVRELVFGRVKICGLTSVRDAKIAFDVGATFGGLIFAPESPRVVAENVAAEIVKHVPLKWVGVFVNADLKHVVKLVEQLNLAAVQLHGDEDEIYVAELRTQLDIEVEIWKAVRIKDKLPKFDFAKINRYVLDTFKANALGGTGETFNWKLLDGIENKNKFILSGGLSPENIIAAEKFGFYALDINSKVESAPGKKNLVKLQQLFQQLRGDFR